MATKTAILLLKATTSLPLNYATCKRKLRQITAKAALELYTPMSEYVWMTIWQRPLLPGGRRINFCTDETDLFCDITHQAWLEWHYVDSLWAPLFIFDLCSVEIE